VQHEIVGGAQQIMSLTGQNPAPLFRFPYSDADALPQVISRLRARGYSFVTLDALTG
jgi:peptidoglycan/xylan/chitin deacetylase (PgdA/CDA1 family)